MTTHRAIGLLTVAVLALLAPPDGWTAAGEPEVATLTESVTVTADRLPDAPLPIERIPAHVTVIDREAIERSGAQTLQDLLSTQPGVVLYDQVGNDIEKTLDLRGFTNGSATRVYLDGVPINDPRNNALALDLVPLDALERVEITRGAGVAVSGGGSSAGVIHLTTRRADELGGSITVAAGSDDGSRLGGDVHGSVGRVGYYLSTVRSTSDGFRENSGGDVHRSAANLDLDVGRSRRVALSLVDSRSNLGNPGALTAAEMRQNAAATPFNSLDFSDERASRAALSFDAALPADLSVALNLFYRDNAARSLTTGRSADLYGGFFVDQDAATLGSTAELRHEHRAGTMENRLAVGLEWLDSDTDSSGFLTDPLDLGTVDPASLASDNLTQARNAAVFVQDAWRPTSSFSVLAGLRWDRNRVGYTERYPLAAPVAWQRFSELSFSAGANWNPSPRTGYYLSYGEAFLAPTAEQLVAFPGFGSNPDLRPEDSRSVELGYRGRFEHELQLDVALFHVDTQDEIVFDPTSELGLFGANVNAGETRRRGVEAAFSGQLTPRVSAFTGVTWNDAEFRSGTTRGNDVPLVPRERIAAGVDADLPAGFGLHVDALYVGEQRLSNDASNTAGRLDAYTLVNLRTTWSVRDLTFFVEATNLFDEFYATRGIFVGDAFFTPAPGRRFLIGADWSF